LWPAAGEEDLGSRCFAEPTSASEAEKQTARTGGSDEILPFALVPSTHIAETLPKFSLLRPISAPTEMGSFSRVWNNLNRGSDSRKQAARGA